MRRRTFRQVLVIGTGLLLVGCGSGAEQAALYRAEKLLYEARKAETQARLATSQPDSTALLQVREAFLKVKRSAPGPYKLEGDARGRARVAAIMRTVGTAEVSGGRLALEAKRADLALETAQRLQSGAATDTATARQAAFMAVAAYQSLRRYDDVVAQMKRILATYPPLSPPPNGEDPVLAIPEAIVNLRRNLGEEQAAARELREALEYYQGLLRRPQTPALEAQVRARVLRTHLELNQVGRALEEANTLERLVMATPSLRSMLAEVGYAKGKIKASTEKNPSEGIAILDRIATDFPNSPLAPRALFEAAVQTESKGRLEDARARYEAILQRFPNTAEVAPLSLYRLGVVQEKLGDWGRAKATFESIPVHYPRSTAAAEAPVAVIQHYAREGRRTAAELYFSKALATYRELIKQDSTGQVAPLARMKMYQIYAAGRDSNGIYEIADEMLRVDRGHPYTAQVLLEAARAAKAFGNSQRATAYLRRFIQEFPRSPVIGDVRRELKEHGG
ncbi:MAG: tetratricopeptide repeat protein [Candidatus Eisenbacteria bacterium]